MEEKKEITSRIKGLVQDRIESGLSQAPQGNSGASPAGKPNGALEILRMDLIRGEVSKEERSAETGFATDCPRAREIKRRA